ncbi:MAG: NAD(P)-dependent oxidoreductase [Candidatus Saganbacteria bacterium]|nr:NAD(P)-dependent oxidoreductase [Candidatus Saganbacteria bacterium]
MLKKLFITGASGCVGHYLFDELIKNRDYELFLLVRDPRKLLFNYKNYPNVHLLEGDLQGIEKFKDTLKEMDYLIHLAVDWTQGEPNYQHTIKLFELLDPVRCQKAIYFSTASILNREHQPFKELPDIGTCYIWSKFFAYRELPKLPIYPKITTLFPTLLVGGDKNHPYSHVAHGIQITKKWIPLIRFLNVEGGVHFIHAEDAAKIAAYLLENPSPGKELVLGYDYMSVNEIINRLCAYFKIKRWFKIKLPFVLLKKLVDYFNIQVSPWDLFCAEYKYFKYNTVRPSTFGLASRFQAFEDLLKEYAKP